MAGDTGDWTFDAFVSYRRSDGAAVANWLRREIQGFRPPRRLGAKAGRRLKVYLDTAYERGTSDFYEREIRPALLASHYLIVLATPDAVRRPEGTPDWMQRELEDFSQGPHAGNVMVVRAAGEFNGALPADIATRFPNIEIVDLRGARRLWFLHPGRAARIAAEKLKVIAPLLDVTSEEMPLLRQEEERRQQARIGSVTGVAAAVLVAVSLLSIYALQSRWRAEGALQSSMDATGRMVQSVADSLQRTGANATLRSNILNEGCDLIDKLRREATREPGVQQMVTCLVERAIAHEQQDEHEDADRLVGAAVAWASDRLSRTASPEPATAVIRARRARAQLLVGRKDLTGAKVEYAGIVADAERFAQTYEDKEDFVIQKAQASAGLAEVCVLADELDKAVQALDDAAATIGGLVSAQADLANPDRMVSQADYLWRAAEVEIKRTDYAATLVRTRHALDIRRAIKTREPLATDNDIAIAELLVVVAAIEAGNRNRDAAQVARSEAQDRVARAETSTVLTPSRRQRIADVKARLARLVSAPQP